MKRISMLLCAILFGTFCATCFAGPYYVGVPHYGRTKTVYPRVVQRTLTEPVCPTACPEVAEVPRVAKVKTVYPRIVQRSMVVPTCCAADNVVTGDVVEVMPRSARTTVIHPRVVQQAIVMP